MLRFLRFRVFFDVASVALLLSIPFILRFKSEQVVKQMREGRHPNQQRENATFVMLARNDDLDKAIDTILSYEDRFNHKFHYDWVFLNDDDFNKEFKERVTRIVTGKPKFGRVPQKHWSYPPWIDQDKAAENRKKMKEEDVIYGGSESYRHMCRFESGFFYQHELMRPYKYYWRVEPETKLVCDVDYDVFKFMRDNNKRYGFTIAVHEFEKTVPTLWDTTQQFLEQNPHYIDPHALDKFVRSEDNPDKYNMCHFWSNFEIADADFWRSEAYTKYFEYLDQAGGFFYERWGDAPVHSLAVSFMMPQDQVYFFEDIGYHHPPYTHCPKFKNKKKPRCVCKPHESVDWVGYSCLKDYMKAKGLPFPK